MKRAEVAVVKMICKLRRVYTFLRKPNEPRNSVTEAQNPSEANETNNNCVEENREHGQ